MSSDMLAPQACCRPRPIVQVKGIIPLRGAGRVALSGVGRAHVFGLIEAKRGFAPYGVSRFRDDVGIVPYDGLRALGLCIVDIARFFDCATLRSE